MIFNAHVRYYLSCGLPWHIEPNILFISLFFKDDIFSPSTVKPVTKAPHKSKKTPPSQETSAAAADSSNIFDDPLNALGGGTKTIKLV